MKAALCSILYANAQVFLENVINNSSNVMRSKFLLFHACLYCSLVLFLLSFEPFMR